MPCPQWSLGRTAGTRQLLGTGGGGGAREPGSLRALSGVSVRSVRAGERRAGGDQIPQRVPECSQRRAQPLGRQRKPTPGSDTKTELRTVPAPRGPSWHLLRLCGPEL